MIFVLPGLLLGCANEVTRQADSRRADQPDSDASRPASDCDATRTEIFACGTDSGSVLLCAAPDGSADLRIGDRIVAVRPPLSGEPAYQTKVYSGGGEDRVTLAGDRERYAFFSRTVRAGFGDGGNDPQTSAGIEVYYNTTGQALGDTMVCTEPTDATFSPDAEKIFGGSRAGN